MIGSFDSPAFPSHGSMGEVAHQGMTLRDYFAAKVLQGLVHADCTVRFIPESWAKEAYLVADAMLEAREFNLDKSEEEIK